METVARRDFPVTAASGADQAPVVEHPVLVVPVPGKSVGTGVRMDHQGLGTGVSVAAPQASVRVPLGLETTSLPDAALWGP